MSEAVQVLRDVYASMAELWCSPRDGDMEEVKGRAEKAITGLEGLDKEGAALLTQFLENPVIPEEEYLYMEMAVSLSVYGEADLIINTTVGKQSIKDSFSIRRSALDRQVPYVTTIRGATAVAKAIEAMKRRKIGVKPIQLYYR